jgi:hypothetical protein
MCDVILKRLNGSIGPLSDRIITDGSFYEPYRKNEKDKYIGKKYVLVKDGRIFGGGEFHITKIDDSMLYMYRDRYFGGGWAEIPLDEIVGIR